jgi:hypothetical protein
MLEFVVLKYLHLDNYIPMQMIHTYPKEKKDEDRNIIDYQR